MSLLEQTNFSRSGLGYNSFASTERFHLPSGKITFEGDNDFARYASWLKDENDTILRYIDSAGAFPRPITAESLQRNYERQKAAWYNMHIVRVKDTKGVILTALIDGVQFGHIEI